MGGSAYTEGGFASAEVAVEGTNKLWATFGLGNKTSDALCPFGTFSVDGFNFDFEASVKNTVDFANQLRTLMNAAATGGKKYYLSAALQCPCPDSNNDGLLIKVAFDLVNV